MAEIFQCAAREGECWCKQVSDEQVSVCSPLGAQPETVLRAVKERYPRTVLGSWGFFDAVSCPTYPGHRHRVYIWVPSVTAATYPGNCALSFHSSGTRAVVCVPANTLDAQAVRAVENRSPAPSGEAWKFGNVCACPLHPGQHIHYTFVQEEIRGGAKMNGVNYCPADVQLSRSTRVAPHFAVLCASLRRSAPQIRATLTSDHPPPNGYEWGPITSEVCPTYPSHRHFSVSTRASVEQSILENYSEIDAAATAWSDVPPAPVMQPMVEMPISVPEPLPDLDAAVELAPEAKGLLTVLQDALGKYSQTDRQSVRVEQVTRFALAGQLLLVHTMQQLHEVKLPELAAMLRNGGADVELTAKQLAGVEVDWKKFSYSDVRKNSAVAIALLQAMEKKFGAPHTSWRKNQKIPLIKLCREMMHWGLKEAKNFVEWSTKERAEL